VAVLAVHVAVAYAAALVMFTLWEWPFMLLRERLLRWRAARRDQAAGISGSPE
jgi:peptidoglycan/LPS O-acetylase OafA/YrhL